MPNIQQFIGYCCNIPYLKAAEYDQATLDERHQARLADGQHLQVLEEMPNTRAALEGFSTLFRQALPSVLLNGLIKPIGAGVYNTQLFVLNLPGMIFRALTPGSLVQSFDRVMGMLMSGYISAREDNEKTDRRSKRNLNDLKAAIDAGDMFTKFEVNSTLGGGFSEARR